METAAAQRDIRNSHAGGGVGAVVSGLVWLVAAFTEAHHGTRTGFIALFFGGMLIFPVSSLIVRAVLKRKAPPAGNPLTPIAMESTIAMIGGLFAAWLLLATAPHYVFPVAAIAVGTHYFPFATLYGDKTYWLLAALIALAGVSAVFHPVPATLLIAGVGAIEIVFGFILYARAGKRRD